MWILITCAEWLLDSGMAAKSWWLWEWCVTSLYRAVKCCRCVKKQSCVFLMFNQSMSSCDWLMLFQSPTSSTTSRVKTPTNEAESLMTSNSLKGPLLCLHEIIVLVDCSICNKLCAWWHNMSLPLSSPMGAQAPRAPPTRRNVAVLSQYVSTLTQQPPYAVRPRWGKWPGDLDLWPWKWCPSHVWHELFLCQFWSS